MSMNPEPENFESLRRLLALKRHEQPPPGYFKVFSRQVIARIRAGEAARQAPFLERLFEEAPWLERLWTPFATKPVLAGAFGMVICGLLISGIVYSEREPVSVAIVPAPEVEQADLAHLVSSPGNPMFQQAAAVSSTGAILPARSGSSLFDEFKARRVIEPASRTFIVPVGN
jgi:hypothetical protein